ncbi:hypothetical protein DRJ25_02095 [Candidatus Woesearchaeota archaeon]|nr:MAG: hypothetical protein DRJ25_02095 [Candidatus Woesearchaeota archaeon]
MVDKLRWCFSKKGVKLIEPNDNLAKEYLQNAEETLVVLRDIEGKSNMWLAATKYYCEYFTIYALLMRLGVKPEIHDCTIKIVAFLEKEAVLERGIEKLLEYDKELRIDNQYYLKNRKVEVDFNGLRDFILEIKELVNTISIEKIEEVREKIKRFF